jgi:transposase
MLDIFRQQTTAESLTKHIEVLDRESLVKIIVLLWEQNRKLEERVLALEKQNQDLLDKLSLNSSNSSKPPSTDKPWDKPNKDKTPSGKKKGGQPGHAPHVHKLVDSDKVDKTVIIKPEFCEYCNSPLMGEGSAARRHQISEIEPVKVTVTEFQVHRLECKNCGKVTAGKLPGEVNGNFYGPNLVALIGMLTTQYHLSKRKVVEFVRDLFGVEISLGAVIGCEKDLSDALKGPVEEIKAYIESRGVANADETGWRESAKRAWVWVMTCQLATVFMIHLRRSQEAAKKLIGEFKGTLGTDRYSAYNVYEGKRQICWAHLVRDFKRFASYVGKAGEVGRNLLEISGQIFETWHKVRDGTITRAEFQGIMEPIIQKTEDLLCEGIESGNSKMMESCYRISCCEGDLWTFVYHELVEPTNNAAERAVRPVVIWRKNCYGTDSKSGSEYVGRMMTACTTLKQQKRSIWEFIRQASSAYYSGQKPPSLLPSV